MVGILNDLKSPDVGVHTSTVSFIKIERKPSRPVKPRIAADGKVMELVLELVVRGDLEYA